jgi:hypothetical protein
VTTERTQQPEPPEPGRRKPYQRPKLEEYGNIRDITKHVGNASPVFDPPPYASLKVTTR